MDLNMYDASYDFLLSHLEDSRGKILELGCGPGNISRYLLKQKPDLKLTGLDISPAMIELAQTNNPGGTFLLGDCRNLSIFKESFDGVVAGFVLPYLSKIDSEKMIEQISRKLSSNGLFYLSFVEGEENESGYMTGSTGDAVYFYYYKEQPLVLVLKSFGFEILNVMREQWPDKPVDEHPHVMIIARKIN
jgi:ubiquinone/menaquinone biosynthesis C-methylase UbiE